MANPIVNTLPAYVDETKEELIVKSILDSKSASMFTLESGVKGATALHLLATEVELQDAHACGFNASGTTEISQRILTPAYLKVNTTFCDKNLLNTYAGYKVKIAAGQKTLPFEEDFINGIVAKVNEANEKMIWQGDKSNGNECDGLLTIASADSSVITSVTRSSDVYADILAVYMATPEAVVSKSDYTIFVGASDFRKFVQELVSKNLYNFGAPTDANGEITIPGTDCKVVMVNGLNGSGAIVGARLSNLYFGTDLQGDAETFDLWYSKDNQEFRLAIEYMIGVQYAYGDEIVIAK